MFGQGGRLATVSGVYWLIWWRQSVAARVVHRRLTRTYRWTLPVLGWRWTGWDRVPGSGADCPPIPQPCWPVTCNSWAPRSNTWWQWSTGRCTGCRSTGYRTLVMVVKTGCASLQRDVRDRPIPPTTMITQRPSCSTSTTTVAACTMTPTTLYHTSTLTRRIHRLKTNPTRRLTTMVSLRLKLLHYFLFSKKFSSHLE